MNENQVDTFLTVVRCGSFTRAAESMFISQPAVTYRIRALEEELGVRLFEGGSFQAMLTPAGKAFCREAQALCDMFAQTRRVMLGYSPQRQIVIGFPEMMLQGECRSFLTVMARCAQELDDRENRLVQSRQLKKAPWHVAQLTQGEVDLIFTDVSLPELEGEAFGRRRLFSDRTMVCMRRNHPLAARGHLKISDLKGETIVLYEDATSFLTHVRRRLNENGITPNGESFPSFVQLLPHLRDGGVTITNQRPIGQAELVYLPLDMGAPIDIGIAWMKARCTPQLRQVIRLIEEMPGEVWK